MARVNFIARADDLGSSHSANLAIRAVAEAGFIKNVSVMAPGPFAEEAAAMLAHRSDVCFGMHTTLNAEWDRVKWGPVLPQNAAAGLTDAAGHFLPDPAMFAETRPPVEAVMAEVNAQLERLHKLGFGIRYLDSHMFPELFIDGLDEAMADFARKKGLIDHMYYYALPPGYRALAQNPAGLAKFIRGLPGGQYFMVAHPALDTEEMRRTGNAQTSGEAVASARAAEAEIFGKKALRRALRLLGCGSLRYDEATPLPRRLGVEDVKGMLA